MRLAVTLQHIMQCYQPVASLRYPCLRILSHLNDLHWEYTRHLERWVPERWLRYQSRSEPNWLFGDEVEKTVSVMHQRLGQSIVQTFCFDRVNLLLVLQERRKDWHGGSRRVRAPTSMGESGAPSAKPPRNSARSRSRLTRSLCGELLAFSG